MAWLEWHDLVASHPLNSHVNAEGSILLQRDAPLKVFDAAPASPALGTMSQKRPELRVMWECRTYATPLARHCDPFVILFAKVCVTCGILMYSIAVLIPGRPWPISSVVLITSGRHWVPLEDLLISSAAVRTPLRNTCHALRSGEVSASSFPGGIVSKYWVFYATSLPPVGLLAPSNEAR
jgi:hypothetical protein